MSNKPLPQGLSASICNIQLEFQICENATPAQFPLGGKKTSAKSPVAVLILPSPQAETFQSRSH